MSIGDILYIIAIIMFAFMTFTIIRNNFLSKFDDQERRKDLIDEYEDEYVSDDTGDTENKENKD